MMNNNPPRKIFDVARPGRSPASSTSRPLIVGHKPQVRDPAVTVNGVGYRRPLMDPRQKVNVDTNAAAPPQVIQPSQISQAGPASVQTGVIAAPIAPSAPSVPSAPSAPAPAPAPQSTTIPGQPGAPIQPILHDDALLDNLPAPNIDEEQIVMSAHMPRQSGAVWSIVLTVVAVVLVAFLVLDILLDAGFLDWNIPHTHFL